MSGELDLGTLLRSLSADLIDGTYVFVTLANGNLPAGLQPRMTFHEAEGTTLIILQSEAEAHGLAFDFPCRMITLNVHSSLEAVGFIARIATVLAAHDMGVNPVSGFFHDHLFVPLGKEEQAMALLQKISDGTL